MRFCSRPLLLPSLLLLVLFSCSNHQDEAPSNSFAHVTPAESEQDALTKTKNAVVNCAPGATCSPSVGLLSFTDLKNAGQCTASLIASNIVATNSHCIPNDLKKSGSSCRGRIWMNFAASTGTDTQIECDRVIYASNITPNTDRPDYAFVRLVRPSSRPVLSVSQEGFHKDGVYRLHKVNPNGNAQLVSGEQESVDCRATFGTEILPSFLDPFAPLAAMSECEVRPGNSGGPLLDPAGKVRGLIFAVHDMAEKTETLGITPGFELNEKKFVPLNLATNFACLHVAGERGDHPSCADLQTRLGRLEQERKNNKDKDQREQFHALMKGNPAHHHFRWKREMFFGQYPAALEPEYAPVPLCVKAEAIAYYQNPVPINRPVWTEQKSFDRYFRTRLVLHPEPSTAGEISLSAQDDGRYQVRINSAGDAFEAQIPLCEAPQEKK